MLSQRDNVIISFISVFILVVVQNIYAQHGFTEILEDKLIWCTTSDEEQNKCLNFTSALERDSGLFDTYFYKLSCHRAFDKDECIQMIDREKAHIMTLDAGDVFDAGRYHSLIPVMQEAYSDGAKNYFAVAVIKAGTMSDVHSLYQLRNKKACFAGVGSQAGWTVPIYTLQREGGMKITDCNNHVKSAIDYFGPSCAINALINKFNPIGDNSDKLCELCIGEIPGGRCTPTDPYADFSGAFKCLMDVGEIAFLKHTTVDDMLATQEFKTLTTDQFELLCKDGSKKTLSEYRLCNWGVVPSNAIVVSSARTSEERRRLQRFLTKAVNLYSHGTSRSSNSNNTSYSTDRYNSRFDNGRSSTDDRFNNRNNYFSTSTTTERYDYNQYNLQNDSQNQLYEKFDLFDSKRYGKRLNLMLQDSTTALLPIPEIDQNYEKYLRSDDPYHASQLDIIYGVRQCPVGRMTLCVTSDAELEKCIKMRTALKAQLVKPEMICYKAHSHINCMQAIQTKVADVAVLDASDVYTAGLRYNLIPFISEVYDLGQPEYYVVAVAKEEDPSTELTYLKGKYTCHSGMNTAAGWVYPMAYLISNGWIRPYGCDSVRAAAEYFTKSCIPGALSSEYNTGVPYDNLCDLCHGPSFRYCRRDASEDFYGHSGAFRCLAEGGGHVAFVKHTTVIENTGGKRKEWWARDTLNDDYELLCPDGTRAEVTEYLRCNLGKVKANAIVARGGYSYNETELNAYINLFIYAQQFYGKKDADDFSFAMYYSVPPYHDLIFQDATRQLKVIDPDNRQFDTYLGSDFMRARRITDCHSAATSLRISNFIAIYLTSILLVFKILM